jgi:hypothetical protein
MPNVLRDYRLLSHELSRDAIAAIRGDTNLPLGDVFTLSGGHDTRTIHIMIFFFFWTNHRSGSGDSSPNPSALP